MTQEEFCDLFETHWKWQMGVFTKEIREEDGLVYNFTYLKTEIFDIVRPLIDNPEKVNLDLVKKRFERLELTPSFYLTEEFQKKGFVEFLIRNGYSFLDSDTWMVLNQKTLSKNDIGIEVVEITPENFSDYYSVLSKVFSDFPANETYLQICKKSLTKKLSTHEFPDFKSELYLVYDNSKPASGAGMFYSVKGNFAYLHDAGTLKEFRGKGYQTDLIRYRTNKALELGIDRIYSLVEQGGKSWKNMIKNGFNQEQIANIITLK